MEQWSKSRVHINDTSRRASDDHGWKSPQPFVLNDAVWAYFFGNWFPGRILKISYGEDIVEILWDDEFCMTRMDLSDIIPRSDGKVDTASNIRV